MDQRGLVARHSQGVLGVYQIAAGPTGRCPVQPRTPLGPDQVNVIIIMFETIHVSFRLLLPEFVRSKRKSKRRLNFFVINQK
jgi:hypothetical protein